jgi:hypothetical protein
MAILLKLSYGFNAIPIKILLDFFIVVAEIDNILNFIWKCEGLGIANSLEKEK